MDVPFLDANETGASEIIAYRSDPPSVRPVIESQNFVPAKATDIMAMRKRLSELEQEIERLRSRDVDESDTSDQRIAELERLLKDKRDNEASLLLMLEQFQPRLDQQRFLIDQLMQRVDAPQATSKS